jgi:hypothetical protein
MLSSDTVNRLTFASSKLERAREHLDAVKAELKLYAESKPCTMTRTNDVSKGRHIITIQTKDPSDRLYVLVGDFAHNLRCVLDHIVYALIVQATGNIPDSNRVQWPVLDAQNDKVFNVQVGAMSSEASRLIEGLQPYHHGTDFKAHVLWKLNKLDIIDKHRRMAINKHVFTVHYPDLPRVGDYKLLDHQSDYVLDIPLELADTLVWYNNAPTIFFGAENELEVHQEELEVMWTFVATEVLPEFYKFCPGG